MEEDKTLYKECLKLLNEWLWDAEKFGDERKSESVYQDQKVDMLNFALRFHKIQTSKEKEQVIDEIEKEMDRLGFCKCEPLGSGEEYCNNGCELRMKLKALRES